MMIVKVEIWPGGRQEFAHEIHRLHIENVSDLAPVSSYDWWTSQGTKGHIKRHRRSDGAWKLIDRIIRGI